MREDVLMFIERKEKEKEAAILAEKDALRKQYETEKQEFLYRNGFSVTKNVSTTEMRSLNAQMKIFGRAYDNVTNSYRIAIADPDITDEEYEALKKAVDDEAEAKAKKNSNQSNKYQVTPTQQMNQNNAKKRLGFLNRPDEYAVKLRSLGTAIIVVGSIFAAILLIVGIVLIDDGDDMSGISLLVSAALTLGGALLFSLLIKAFAEIVQNTKTTANALIYGLEKDWEE